jgi:hypothetical protein
MYKGFELRILIFERKKSNEKWPVFFKMFGGQIRNDVDDDINFNFSKIIFYSKDQGR